MPHDTTKSTSYLEGVRAGNAYVEKLRGSPTAQSLTATPAIKGTLHLAGSQPMRQDEVKPSILLDQFREDTAAGKQPSAAAARARMYARIDRNDTEEAQIGMDDAASRMDSAQLQMEAGRGKTSAAVMARRRMIGHENQYAFRRPSERADQRDLVSKPVSSAAQARQRMLRGG